MIYSTTCMVILLLSIINIPVISEKTVELKSYGYIIPLSYGEYTSDETFEDSKVRNLINDLLRLNMTVYWSLKNFSVLSKSFDDYDSAQENIFNRGSFVIPFTGDLFEDAMITAVVMDYNQTNEIEPSDIHTRAYYLLDNLIISSNKLVEPKIVQLLGRTMRYGWPCYYLIAEAGGFLNFDFLLDDELASSLNNDDFNIFMWPYSAVPSTKIEDAYSLYNKKGCNSIRNFVRNGGGYIGSCYGSLAASSGIILPIPSFSLTHYYSFNLSCPIRSPTLSISDNLNYLRILPITHLYTCTSEIIDTNHPLTFGVNKTIIDFFRGPWIIWLGDNSKPLTKISDITFDGEETLNDALLEKSLINSPSWVYSTFGDGKVVQFVSHPEYVNNISVLSFENWNGDIYHGRRIIQNSFFYVSSIENQTTSTNHCHSLKLIEKLGKKTKNLSIENDSDNYFTDIINRLDQQNQKLLFLKDTAVDIYHYFSDVFNSYFSKPVRYTNYISELFIEYNDKTKNTLNKIEKTFPKLVEFNDTIVSKIEILHYNISGRINKTEDIINEVLVITSKLKQLINLKKGIIQRIILLKEAKNMLRTEEICLKYIPQNYLESLKLLRDSWYSYETYMAFYCE